jgi:adenosylhomocysteine nucleosidase
MQKEADPILAKCVIAKSRKVGFAIFYEVTMGKVPFVLVVSGIGKAFAASALQALAILYPNVDSCLNVGVAGSLDSKKAPLFSAIVPEALIEHDYDTSALGDPKGLIAGLNIIKIPANPALRNKLVAAAKANGTPVSGGIVSSGDTFCADPKKKKEIVDTFGSISCDMEAAPYGQIALVNRMAYAVLRVISDADNPASEYPANAAKAGTIAASIVSHFILD